MLATTMAFVIEDKHIKLLRHNKYNDTEKLLKCFLLREWTLVGLEKLSCITFMPKIPLVVNVVLVVHKQ